MGTKLAEKAVVRDQGLNEAFREGATEAHPGEAVEFTVTLIKEHATVSSQTFAYMDGALAYAAEHLRRGKGYGVRIMCRETTAVAAGEVGPAENDDIVDAEIVD